MDKWTIGCYVNNPSKNVLFFRDWLLSFVTFHLMYGEFYLYAHQLDRNAHLIDESKAFPSLINVRFFVLSFSSCINGCFNRQSSKNDKVIWTK